MAIESVVMVRRAVRGACRVLVAGLLAAGAARAQAPIKPPVPVLSGSVVPFNHGSTGPWNQIYSIRVAHNGSVLFLDSAASNIYQLSPGATTPTLVVGPAPTGKNSNGSTLEASGSYWNGGMALDANDTLYITDRYGSSVHFLRVPYDKDAGTWLFSSSSNWSNSPSVVQNGSPTRISPQDITIGDDGTFYVSWSTTGEIDKFTVDANGNPSAVTQVITGMMTIASNLAVDHAGNLYFIENAYTQPSKRVNGVRIIPAGVHGLVGDSTGTLEQGFARLDPASANFAFKGLTFDAAGNLYLSSQNDGNNYGGNVDLVLMVPNEGTPTSPKLVWNDAVQVAPVGAGFPVGLDPRGYLWIPTGGGGSNWAPPGTTPDGCVTANISTCYASSIVLWAPGSANLAASPVGTAGKPSTIFFTFSKPTTLGSAAFSGPGGANFTILPENPNADPTATTPVAPCTAGTSYPAFSAQELNTTQYSWCAVYAELNSTFVGSVSGELQLQDASKNVLTGSNVYVNGVGQGAAVSVLSPAASAPIALGLQAPKQVAADTWGGSYVADSTLAAVEYYPAGQTSTIVGTAIGTGLKSPTGVAVDPVGDVFIGDSGNVILVPSINGVLQPKQQVTLRSGLGSHLTLAADGIGDVFVADADNKQVLKIPNTGASALIGNTSTYPLGTGLDLTGPSAIAADNDGNVFVADGTNLYELTEWGQSTAITSALNAPVTGLAVDPSGSVYVVENGGVVWIPYNTSSGSYDVNGSVQIATTLGNQATPFSVALDGSQNAYISYGTASTAGLARVGTSGSINWGTIVPYIENDQEAQIYNLGNAPLTFTDFSKDTFTGASASDYAVTAAFDAPQCDPGTPLAPGLGCYLGIALSPSNSTGPNTAALGLQSDAVNAPAVNIALSANIVPDLRNATTTSVSVSPDSGIVYPGSATVTVTVAANDASKGTPTGQATLIVTGLATQTAPLTNGTATFSLSGMLGGAKTVRAQYGGGGTAGTEPNFAGSAAKTTFTVETATPAGTAALPAAGQNVTVWAGNTYIIHGQLTTITATVTSKVGTPTGTVTFMQNGQPVDPAQTAIPLDANGNATFVTSNLTLGTYNLTAVYSGDVNFGTISTAVPAFQIINKSIQITSDPPSINVTAGTPATATLTLKPLVGFNDQVGIQCVSATLPQYSECTFAYPISGTPLINVGNNGTTPSTIVVTLNTNVPVNAGNSATAAKKAAGTGMKLGLAGLFGAGMLGLFLARRRVNRCLAVLSMVLMLAGALGGMTACTNSSYSKTPPAPKVVTPSGTYNIQIITVNSKTGQQNSLTSPVFSLTAVVQ